MFVLRVYSTLRNAVVIGALLGSAVTAVRADNVVGFDSDPAGLFPGNNFQSAAPDSQLAFFSALGGGLIAVFPASSFGGTTGNVLVVRPGVKIDFSVPASSLTFSFGGALPVGANAVLTLSNEDQQVGQQSQLVTANPLQTISFEGGPFTSASFSFSPNTLPLFFIDNVHFVTNRPPTANGGPDQTLAVLHDGDATTHTADVTLDGSGSSDPDPGDMLTYVWKENGVPVANGVNPTIPLEQGDHTVTLVVMDNHGATSNTDDVFIQVTEEQNHPPTADAGADQTVTVPHDGDPSTKTASFTLNGGAADTDDATMSVEWMEGATALGSTPSLTVTRPVGKHTFTLKVTDPYGASTSDDVVVEVLAEPNQEPTANAGADQTVTVPHDGDPATGSVSFTLNGMVADPDADTVDQQWLEGATSLGSSPSLTLTRSPGSYTFTLKVTDSYGASSSDDVIVTVLPEANEAPVANAGAEQAVTVSHDGDPSTKSASFTLQGGASDPDGDSLSQEWLEGATSLGSDPTQTLARPVGNYTFTFKVTDSYGVSKTDEVVIEVQPEPNQPPVAKAGADQTGTVPHDGNPTTQTVSFTLNGTAADPDGDTVKQEWFEGAASLGSSPSLSLTRPAGTYTFTLKVTDAYGVTATDDVVVKVLPEPNQVPVANAGADQTVAASGALTPVTLNGSASFDLDGATDPLTYAWSEGVTALGSSPNLPANLSPGIHTLTLTVTDPYGAASHDNVVVHVLYSWSGLLSPIRADGTSVLKLGRTVPVKFQLTGASAAITNLAARLFYAKVAGPDAIGDVNEEAESTSAATTGNLFRYDPGSGQYIFNWSTSGLTAGKYKLLIDLGDGPPRTVFLGLR